jgi:Uncharacterized protein conserved in bacteria
MKKYRILQASESRIGVSIEVAVETIDIDSGADGVTVIKKFIISKKKYKEIGIRTHAIDDVTFSAIGEAHVLHEAVKKGVDLLSYSDHTKEQIRRKLTERGYPRETAAAAADELEAAGLIREGEQAVRAAEIMVRKKRGPGRIRTDLYQKGFARDAIAHAVDAMESKYNFAEMCAEVIEKKYGEIPADPDERRKMTAFLVRSGFTSSHIRDAEKSLRG